MLYGIGKMIEEAPTIQKTLKILDPTILPTAISFCFLIPATTDVASSGKLVPIATIVRPIKASDSPAKRARIVALSTNSLPPKNNPPDC